jgi:hypothetical protein
MIYNKLWIRKNPENGGWKRVDRAWGFARLLCCDRGGMLPRFADGKETLAGTKPSASGEIFIGVTADHGLRVSRTPPQSPVAFLSPDSAGATVAGRC